MSAKKYPEGHFVGMWMAIYMAIFTGVGIALSTATDNFAFIGLGPAIGLTLGVAIGQSYEKKYKEKGLIRPLNRKEKGRKRLGVYAGIGALVLGAAAFLIAYLIL